VEALNELRRAQQDIEQQQRADEARVERQRQSRQLISEARTALRAQQFAKALEALAWAREIDATVVVLSELTDQARAGQAAATARTRESEQITAEASQLFDKGDLARATQLLNRAVDLDSQNASASALAAQVRVAAEQRSAAEAAERLHRQQEVETLLAAASQHLQAGDFTRAGELLESILLEEPTHAGAQKLKGALDRAIRTAQKEAARREQQMTNGLAAAVKHADRRKFPQAIHALEEVLRLEPQHERATRLLAEVRGAEQRHRDAQQVDALLRQATGADSHERAIALLRQALTLAPDDQRVAEMLLNREAARSPDLGDRALDVGNRRAEAASARGQSPRPRRWAGKFVLDRESVWIVGLVVVVALAILGIQFWRVQSPSPVVVTPTVPHDPKPGLPPPPLPPEPQTFTVTIEGKYQFEVEYPGGRRSASKTHSIKLPAGTATRVRLRNSGVFLDIWKSLQGAADTAQTITAPPLSSVNVYNSYNETCEILIDGRLVGYQRSKNRLRTNWRRSASEAPPCGRRWKMARN
jgi:tetratricopeptide (TPR) repeat protein